MDDQFYKINTTSSKFISFEGIEGSGKTTQIKNVTEYLTSLGYNVHILREPGGTSFGEKLREAILQSETKLPAISEAYLFAASRAHLLSSKVIPLLEQEKQIIILDRYIDSSIAYQGFARKLGAQKIIDIHKSSPLNLLPNKTFYLEIDVKTSMARQDARGQEKDYFEQEKQTFYECLIDGYNYCKTNFSDRFVAIDGSESVEEVSRKVIQELKSII